MTLVCCWRVGSVGQHAGGVAKADDSDGSSSSCEGRETAGRYVNTIAGTFSRLKIPEDNDVGHGHFFSFSWSFEGWP